MNARSAEPRRHHPVRRPRPSVPGRAKATPTRLRRCSVRRCSGCVVFVRIGSILARTDGAGHSRAIRQRAQRTQRVDPRAAFTRVEHAERVRRSRRVGMGVGGFRPFVELDCCEHVPVSVAGGPDAGNAQKGDSATSSHRGNACRARAGSKTVIGVGIRRRSTPPTSGGASAFRAPGDARSRRNRGRGRGDRAAAARAAGRSRRW